MPIVYNPHTDADPFQQSRTDAPNGSVETLTESERVYRTLKRAILAGDFRPGEALQESRLAAELGASRTPVRESFRRLESDGLLMIVPHRGTFVQQPTAREFFDINELRLILEPLAAKMAAAIIDASLVEDLQRDLAAIAAVSPTETDFIALEELDRRMHLTITQTIENGRMARIILGLNDMLEIVREKDMRRRHTEMHLSIEGILASLATRDSDLAESLMRRHISDFSGALRTLV